jgi:hypothetical protein
LGKLFSAGFGLKTGFSLNKMDLDKQGSSGYGIKKWFSSGSWVLRLTGFSRVWAFGNFHWVRIGFGFSGLGWVLFHWVRIKNGPFNNNRILD